MFETDRIVRDGANGDTAHRVRGGAGTEIRYTVAMSFARYVVVNYDLRPRRDVGPPETFHNWILLGVSLTFPIRKKIYTRTIRGKTRGRFRPRRDSLDAREAWPRVQHEYPTARTTRYARRGYSGVSTSECVPKNRSARENGNVPIGRAVRCIFFFLSRSGRENCKNVRKLRDDDLEVNRN